MCSTSHCSTSPRGSSTIHPPPSRQKQTETCPRRTLMSEKFGPPRQPKNSLSRVPHKGLSLARAAKCTEGRATSAQHQQRQVLCASPECRVRCTVPIAVNNEGQSGTPRPAGHVEASQEVRLRTSRMIRILALRPRRVPNPTPTPSFD